MGGSGGQAGKRDPERLRAVHKFLFRRYDQRLEGLEAKDVAPEHEQALLEAFYHAPEAIGFELTVEWFIRRAHVFSEAGRHRLLLAPYQQLVRDTEDHLGPQHPQTWAVLGEAAQVLTRLCSLEEADLLARRAVKLCEQTGGPENTTLAYHVLNLAFVVLDSGAAGFAQEAEQLARRSLALQESNPTRDERRYADALQLVGFCCLLNGRFDEAEERCRSALSIYRRINDVSSEAWMLRDLGLIHLLAGSYLRAEDAYREAETFMTRTLGPDSHRLGALQSELGELNTRQGRFGEAESLIKAALGTWVRAQYEDAGWLGEGYGRLGETYIYQGRYAEAAEALQQAVLTIGDSIPLGNFFRVAVEGLRGWLAVRRGDLEDAEGLLERARDAGARTCQPENPDFFPILLHLGELRRKQHRYDEAEQVLNEALEIVQTKLRPDHPRAGEILLELANLRDDQARTEEAEQLRAEGRTMRDREGCVT